MIWIGTSGYSYPEWRGSFYPEKFPTSKMLDYYAARFSTVEINNTFYRLPSEKMLTDWAKGVPANFHFTLKATRSITHDARLRDCGELVEVFCARALTLGPKLGVALFQLPPSFRKNLAVLDAFLDLIPRKLRAAFEFRHASWFSEDVYATLKARNMALCTTDSADTTDPIVLTADYGYFRLRDEGYQESDLEKWGKTILSYTLDWQEVFVYFKHEEEGMGAKFAQSLSDIISSRT